MPYRSNESETD